jgi:phosphoribosylformylglycinamidine synthase I
MLPSVLIMCTNGTNRSAELAHAFSLAGAQTEVAHLNELRANKKRLSNYQILAIPGGFSYADILGAGRLFAIDLKQHFEEELKNFIDSKKPVIGICNGFQVLVKAGLLPEIKKSSSAATLTFNKSGNFECRWVYLKSASKMCLWTSDLHELVYCPVAHGEGRLVLEQPEDMHHLQENNQIACAKEVFPYNPNGSIAGIAGLCNATGNVLGLMPHPEDHVLNIQHPRFTRKEHGNLALKLFINGVKAA